MIEITYYNDAIYVLYNNQDISEISDMCVEDEVTFRIYAKGHIARPIMYWDDICAEDDSGEEYDYSYVTVEIPFGWTGKIPILERDKKELAFVVDTNYWLACVEPERVVLNDTQC